MHSTRCYLLVFTLIALAGIASPSASAQTFVTLNFPDATATQAYDINDSGLVVGRYVAAGVAHGFVYDGTTFTSINYPGAAWTEAWGINKNGDIVGQYGSTADTLRHGFLLTAGNFTSVDQSGKFNTMPQGLNRAGYIIGCAHNQGGMQGWVMLNDDFLSVSPGFPAYGMYTGVNDSGTIVGWSFTPPSGESSFVLSGIGRTEFQYPGAPVTEAQGLNALGDVVGSYGPSSTLHGFLFSDGQFSTIDVPETGVKFTRAFGINTKGTIVGVYQDANNHFHGFLREP